MLLPFLLALGLNSKYLKGAGAFRVLFFLPYVIPFVSGVLIWQGMLNLETGWVNGVPALHSASRTRPTGSTTPTSIYPALVFIGIWGIGAGIIVNLAGLRGIPTELYDAAQHRRRRLVGAAAQRDPADDVAGHLLHADPGHRGGAPVLPRAAGHQQRHGRAGRHARCSSTSTCTRRSSPTRTWPTARPSPGCCSRSPWSCRSSCSGSRGAGSTTRASADVAASDGVQDLARARTRARAGAGRGPTGRATLRRSFTLTFVLVVVLAAFLSPLLRSAVVSLKTPDQLSETDAPVPALAAPARSSSRARTLDVYVVPLPTGDRDARARQARPPAERLHRPGEPAAAGRSPGTGSWRTLTRAWTLSPAFAELRRRLGRSSTSRGCCSTRSRSRSSGWSGRRLVHARRVRVRAVPVPRPQRSCSRSSSRRSSCRRR